ncbi:LDH2 family malate/lactate/ureidoglycolate dehydrogenase [Lipingzhangella halophila]|uniref:LDH2 family malate/lactate/ureidoglycolate dehydrogenase n=1 Tax=Lipingzhangella halophila TaxID=1783352 RepID=A0A7W7RCV6_9ACTN|nr:Ldh family oxidoreductase [Lipingzhangella halophila]MBB4929525.1 LDH2 family malate/lactate/ureidoglycolate dehydrogenase [Lipingzhangella halophila]
MPERVPPRSVTAMHDFSTEVLTAFGAGPATARAASRHMLWADRRGTETHGLVRLPAYIEKIRGGALDPHARPLVEPGNGATFTVDGGDGLGHPAADLAMASALGACKKNGVAAATVRNSGHFGAAGSYAEMAASAGAVGIAMTNAAPLMAPTGGKERRLGNNPVAIAVPFREFPIVLDIAMSAIAAGSIMLAARRGEAIPEQWGLDSEGQPTADPEAVLTNGGLLRPLGDHKGYGLALMVDLLTAVLSDGTPGVDVRRLDQDGPVGASHTFVALDIEAFTDREGFDARVDALVAAVRSTQLARGADRILLPGEREAETARERDENGIGYPADIFAALEPLAEAARVPLPPPLEPAAPTAEAGR